MSEELSPKLCGWAVAYVFAVVIQGFFITGFAMGFTSPVLADLEDKEGYASLHRSIYQDLFNLSLLIGATVSVLFGGYLTDKVGRKPSMILCSVIYAIGWLLIVLTAKFTHSPLFRVLLFTGRFVVGISLGWTSLCVNLYVSEMSPAKIRGASLVLNQLSLNIGLFLGQIIGIVISYYWLAIIPLAVTTSFMLFTTIAKETPQWLVSQHKVNKAKLVLISLRGQNYNINQELSNLSNRKSSDQKMTLLEMCRELTDRSTYHPVILSCLLFLFLQFSGITAVILNAQSIFKQAHVKSPGLVSSLATGGVTIIFSVVGVLINDLFGRRKILITAYIAAFLSHVVMGAYEFVNTKPYCHPPDDPQCKDHLYPLAIVSIACFIASYSVGISAVTFSLIAEIIPLRVRGLGMGLSMFINYSISALTAGLFNSFVDVVRPWGAFWMFSVMCLLAAIFVAIFIPETKKMSLEEIEDSFIKKEAEER